MKLSQITTEQIKLLSDEQLNSIVFGGEGADNVTDGGCADVALLLGTRPDIAKERAEAAAELYLGGRVRHIIPTGGVEWETDGRTVSEARYMADILCSLGVPEDAITLEEEARTTKENMIFGTPTDQQTSQAAAYQNLHDRHVGIPSAQESCAGRTLVAPLDDNIGIRCRLCLRYAA